MKLDGDILVTFVMISVMVDISDQIRGDICDNIQYGYIRDM